MRRSAVFFFFFVLFFPQKSLCAATDDTDPIAGILKVAGSAVSSVFDLGNIVVGGKRLASPLHEFVSSSVSSGYVVTRKDIELSGARNMPEALKEVPGIVVTDLSGNGQEPALDFRGFSEGTNLVFSLDGVRLNEAKSNNVNFPLIPVSMVERIEVSRGGASFLYGEGAMAGVANIVSAVPTQQGTHGKVKSLAGDFGEWGESFELTDLRESGIGLFVSGDIYQTEGFRQNTSVESYHLYSKVIWDVSDKLRVALSYLFADARLDRSGSIRESLLGSLGPEATERPRNYSDLGAHLGSVNFNLEMWESAVLSGNAYWRHSSEDSVANFATFDTDDNELVLDADTWGTAAQIDQAHDLFWGLRENWLFGFDLVQSGVDEKDYARSKVTLGRLSPTVDADSSKDAFGVFTKASVSWKDRVGAYLGLRYDDIRFKNNDLINLDNNTPSGFSKYSYSAGLSADLCSEMTVSALYGHSFRAPSLSDLYANPLFGGNPDLKPEESSDYELGVKWNPGPLEAKTAVFMNDRTNEIGFDPNLTDSSHLFGRNNNFGQTQRIGVETSVESHPAHWLRLRGSYAYTEAFYNSNTADGTQTSGDHIPMVPRNRFAGDIMIEPVKNLQLDLGALVVSKQVLTNDITNDRNGRRLPAYTVFDLKGVYKRRGWEFSLEVRNFFDERYAAAGSVGAVPSAFNADPTVEDNFFVPAPGRSCMGTVSFSW